MGFRRGGRTKAEAMEVAHKELIAAEKDMLAANDADEKQRESDEDYGLHPLDGITIGKTKEVKEEDRDSVDLPACAASPTASEASDTPGLAGTENKALEQLIELCEKKRDAKGMKTDDPTPTGGVALKLCDSPPAANDGPPKGGVPIGLTGLKSPLEQHRVVDFSTDPTARSIEPYER